MLGETVTTQEVHESFYDIIFCRFLNKVFLPNNYYKFWCMNQSLKLTYVSIDIGFPNCSLCCKLT